MLGGGNNERLQAAAALNGVTGSHSSNGRLRWLLVWF